MAEHAQGLCRPILGALPVAEIDVPLVLKAVLDWAKARGLRQGDNPAAWSIIGEVLPARGPKQHHAALPYQDIPGFMAALRARDGVAAQALEFLINTA
jgi:hypothetical protein